VVFAQFFQNRTHDIRLDYTAKLFMSLGYAVDDAVLMPDHYGLGASHHKFGLGSLVWSRLSGTMPVSIHFPGKSKPFMFAWWPLTWWARLGDDELRRRMAGKGVHLADTNEFLPWETLCSDLFLEEQTFTLDDKFKEYRPPPANKP